jgi:hypothetical protein
VIVLSIIKCILKYGPKYIYETKELAVDLTLSNIFSRSYHGRAAVDDFKTSRNARPTKPCTTRKGLQSPGPQLHALGPLHTIMGDTGPVV